MSTPGLERPGPGYLLVTGVSLVLGAIGLFPFVLASYAVTRWILVPLGAVPVDPTNDISLVVLAVGGVVAPLAVLAAWFVGVRGLVIGRALAPVPSWSAALVLLAAPTVAFLLLR